MSRTVTAMFDSRSQAEAARERLTGSSIDADDIRIVDQSESASSGGDGGEGQGLWAAIKAAFIPPEDSHSYEEGLRRGGYLLCARVDEDRADEAVRILDESESVDLDERETSWRSEGWTPYQSTEGSVGFEQAGRREAERGGARVRSFVRETPAGVQTDLREEHVSIEHRPVEPIVSQSDLESGMTQDDVRQTEVEADEGVRETAGRSAFGGFGGSAPGGTEEERPVGESLEESGKSRY